MYAILDENKLSDFEDRELPLSELVHEGLRHLYIEIPNNHGLKIGDIWDAENGKWIITELPDTPIPVIVVEPNQPTNSEIAQMISDLQADLLISGVIV